jgi:hypothetical protein
VSGAQRAAGGLQTCQAGALGAASAGVCGYVYACSWGERQCGWCEQSRCWGPSAADSFAQQQACHCSCHCADL